MSRYDDNDDVVFLIKPQGMPGSTKPPSPAGLLSFLMAILAGIAVSVSVVLALLGEGLGLLRSFILLGAITLVFVSGLIAVTGVVLGLAGTFEAGRRSLYAWLGFALNTLVLIGITLSCCLLLSSR